MTCAPPAVLVFRTRPRAILCRWSTKSYLDARLAQGGGMRSEQLIFDAKYVS